MVKWCSQTYDLSTWETQETVKKVKKKKKTCCKNPKGCKPRSSFLPLLPTNFQIDPEKIGEFHLRRVLDDKKVVSYELGSKRPGESAFRTIKESPE